MMKPLNVRYVYPLVPVRKDMPLPKELQDKEVVVIFNIESDRADDLMNDKFQVDYLRSHIHETLQQAKDIGVLIMLPESLSKFFEAVFEPYFTKNVAIVAVTQPHSFRFVN